MTQEDVQKLELVSSFNELEPKDENGRVLPMTVTQRVVPRPLKLRKDEIVHRVLDGMAEMPIEDQILDMGIERASRVFQRLWTEKDVRVDANITAMGLLAMFPVVIEE